MLPKIKLADQCSRCPREQERVVTLEEAVATMKAGDNKKKSVEIFMDGTLVAAYEKLCDACRSIVCAYISGATKPVEKKSAKRVVGKVKKAAQPEKPAAKK